MDYGICLLLIEGEEKVALFIKRGLVGRSFPVRA
jgi:hypothetical protein